MALPVGVTQPMAASGGVVPTSLVEVLTASGNLYCWSDQRAAWPSVIAGLASTMYAPWIVGAPEFHLFGSTQTDTASISVQNLSGNTVERDARVAFSETEFIGAYVYFRMWRGDAEQSILTFTGNITGVDIDDEQMDITIEGFGNWSAVTGLPYQIDVACGLFFGSEQCGSTSPTPCQQSYGTCSSLQRFMGFVVQWDASLATASGIQIAQPAPAVAYNPARPF